MIRVNKNYTKPVSDEFEELLETIDTLNTNTPKQYKIINPPLTNRTPITYPHEFQLKDKIIEIFNEMKICRLYRWRTAYETFGSVVDKCREIIKKIPTGDKRYLIYDYGNWSSAT